MRETTDELRKQLVAEAVTTMNTLLTDAVLEQIQRGQISLTEIEEQALTIRQQVGERITQQMLSQAAQGQQGAVLCPTCGERMQNKGHKTRQVVTRTGTSTITRTYYYCRHCKQGHFPPG
jgi:phage terminase large subunit GpA-like protein